MCDNIKVAAEEDFRLLHIFGKGNKRWNIAMVILFYCDIIKRLHVINHEFETACNVFRT